MLTVLEKADLLQNVEIFRAVRTESLAHIAAMTQELSFETSQVLYRENEAPDAMFALLEGEVALIRASQGEQKLGEFQTAGTRALLADRPHSETARTTRPTRLLKIDQQDLFDLMAEDLHVTRGILRALIEMVPVLR
jgi:CRP-like cAMP-binding protein